MATLRTVTFQPDSGGKDTYINSSNQTLNSGNLTNLVMGNLFAISNFRFRTLLDFNLASLPGDSTLISCLLYLTIQSSSGIDGSQVFQLKRLTRNWTELGATWLTYDGTNPWTTPGGDYSNSIVSSFTPANSMDDPVFDVEPLVADAITNRAGMLRLLGFGPENTGANNFLNFSSAHFSSADRPRLVIEFTSAYLDSLVMCLDADDLPVTNLVIGDTGCAA